MYDMKPYLQTIEEVIAKGPFQDTWESLSAYKVPDWYRNAKLGIFIHWGIFSVPAFGNEWYPRNMYIKDSPEFKHHVETYGPHKDFGYKDFIPMFKGEKFDPEAWIDLFCQAGARYVVPVAEFHDGFPMYRSEITSWNAYEMGPKRDVVGEIGACCEKRGLVLGASSHSFEHWFFMGEGKTFDSDVKEPMERGDFYWPAMPFGGPQDIFAKPEPTEEYLQSWLVRTCELIDKYRPKVLWFDWWIQHHVCKPYLKKLAAYYYNRAAEWGIEVAINYKHDSFLFGTAVPDVERGQFAEIKPYFWQTDTAVALNSWCYTENNQFRPAEDILCDLVDVVSKNGCMLLNIGPRADGTITDEDRNILLHIGQWMKDNGEAIYDTKVWRKYGEGPTQIVDGGFSDSIKKEFTSKDFRFTTAGSCVYAIALKCSENGKYDIESLGEKDASKQANFHGLIHKVELLKTGEALEWTRDEEALHIKCDYKTTDPIAFRIRVE